MISTKRGLRIAVAIIFIALALSYNYVGFDSNLYVFALGFAGGYILNDAFPKRRKKK